MVKPAKENKCTESIKRLTEKDVALRLKKLS